MSDLKVGSLSAVGAPLIGATAVGASDPKAVVAAAAKRAEPQQASLTPATMQSAAAAPVVETGALDAGDQPVDIDRVATIRSAIASGHYPLVPARIGDAMIAAGILLQSGTA